MTARAQFPKYTGPLLNLESVDLVAFMGDEVFGPEREHGFLEQMLTAEVGGAGVTFRHLPLTNGALASFRPTVVFLHLAPEDYLPGTGAVLDFSNRVERMVSMVQTQALARIVLLGPLPSEKRPPPHPDPGPANTTRAGYDSVLKQLAQARGLRFVSLLDGLKYQFMSPKEPLTHNGTRLNLRGSQLVAGAIASGLQIMHHWRMSIEPDGKQQPGGFGHSVSNLVRNGGLISFTSYSDKLENAPASGTNGNFIITPSLLRLKSLPPGRHALRIDGRVVMEAMDREWQHGLPITAGPAYDQSEALRQAIVRKNSLTGNAPFGEVDGLRAEIRRLARPMPHRFEIVPAASDGPAKP